MSPVIIGSYIRSSHLSLKAPHLQNSCGVKVSMIFQKSVFPLYSLEDEFECLYVYR